MVGKINPIWRSARIGNVAEKKVSVQNRSEDEETKLNRTLVARMHGNHANHENTAMVPEVIRLDNM